jgi:hypothetical protein
MQAEEYPHPFSPPSSPSPIKGEDFVCSPLYAPRITLAAGCSKALRYKAPEVPRSESYSPVRRNDEG